MKQIIVKRANIFVIFFLLILSMGLRPLEAKVSSEGYNGLYQKIYNALIKLRSGVNTAQYSTDSDYVFQVLDDVLADHPEIFYFNYKRSLFYENGYLKLGYKYYHKTIRKMRKKLEYMVSYVLSQYTSDSMPDYEKARAIHDYIVTHTVYDYENYENNTIPFLSYTPYGILVRGTGVCEGYAKTFKLLCNRVGIKAMVISGHGNGGEHAWNIVKISGQYYQTDVTWDDSVPDTGELRHKYFLISDNAMAQDHSWNHSKYPACPDSYYIPGSYVSENGSEQHRHKKFNWRGISLEFSESMMSTHADTMMRLLMQNPAMFLPPFTGLENYPEVYDSLNVLSDVKLVFHPRDYFEFGFGYVWNPVPANTSGYAMKSYFYGKNKRDGFLINLGLRLPIFKHFSLYGNTDWIISQNDMARIEAGDNSGFLNHLRLNGGFDLKFGPLVLSLYYTRSFSELLSSQINQFDGMGIAIKLWAQ